MNKSNHNKIKFNQPPLLRAKSRFVILNRRFLVYNASFRFLIRSTRTIKHRLSADLKRKNTLHIINHKKANINLCYRFEPYTNVRLNISTDQLVFPVRNTWKSKILLKHQVHRFFPDTFDSLPFLHPPDKY